MEEYRQEARGDPEGSIQCLVFSCVPDQSLKFKVSPENLGTLFPIIGPFGYCGTCGTFGHLGQIRNQK